MLILVFILAFAAAFVGTTVMTGAQYLERKTRGGAQSPPRAGFGRVFNISWNASDIPENRWLDFAAHFGWGALWGWPLPLLFMFLQPQTGKALLLVVAIYFLIILFQELAALQASKITGPVWTWERRQIASLVVMKLIYTTVTVFAFLLLAGLAASIIIR